MRYSRDWRNDNWACKTEKSPLRIPSPRDGLEARRIGEVGLMLFHGQLTRFLNSVFYFCLDEFVPSGRVAVFVEDRRKCRYFF